jgi:hypothetical protein
MPKAEAAKETFTGDEYDLQPDELTKEMFAELAGWTSDRNVENLMKAGKIAYTQPRRRIKGVVRNKVTIIKREDAEAFLNQDKDKRHGVIEKPNGSEQTGKLATSPAFANNFMDFMNQFAAPRSKSILTELSGKIFIGIDELARFSGIAKSRLEIAIKDAGEKGILNHYTGERGRSVYKCEQLDLLIENLPPTPKQLPPKKKEG